MEILERRLDRGQLAIGIVANGRVALGLFADLMREFDRCFRRFALQRRRRVGHFLSIDAMATDCVILRHDPDACHCGADDIVERALAELRVMMAGVADGGRDIRSHPLFRLVDALGRLAGSKWVDGIILRGETLLMIDGAFGERWRAMRVIWAADAATEDEDEDERVPEIARAA
jgi:hypothetical protein